MRESRVGRVSLMHVLTVSDSLIFLRGHGDFFRERGFDLTFVTSESEKLHEYAARELARAFPVEMARKITPLKDARALYQLWRLMRREKPAIVHAHTPKGGLLGMTAAFLARTPTRVYHMRGLPMMTASGTKRALLRASEIVSCALADEVLCASPSLRSTALREKLSSPSKLKVLHHGSNGVDARGLFSPEKYDESSRAQIRRELGLPETAVVIGFVGRIVNDKGVRELLTAFQKISTQHADAHLLVVGKFEERDAVTPEIASALQSHPRIHMIGQVKDMARHYAAMDVVVLPTYREGFPNVLLEAAAMGLPIVATKVDGCVDAVADGTTGMLVLPRESDSLAAAILAYVSDASLRKKHGAEGRARVLRDFDPRDVREALRARYEKLLAANAPHAQRGWRLAVKKTFDKTLAGAALVALSPAIAGVAVAIALTMGTPVLFSQTRPGFSGKSFRVFKFRTMSDARDARGELLPDAKRLTALGKFLRASSLDELPQLWNVVRGEMSLVGPRPLLVQYLKRYSKDQARRHDVLPGITGWTQINGRNAGSWDEKFALDLFYVDHWSLALDLKIIFRTFRSVLRRSGISNDGHATMPEFIGNELHANA